MISVGKGDKVLLKNGFVHIIERYISDEKIYLSSKKLIEKAYIKKVLSKAHYLGTDKFVVFNNPDYYFWTNGKDKIKFLDLSIEIQIISNRIIFERKDVFPERWIVDKATYYEDKKRRIGSGLIIFSNNKYPTYLFNNVVTYLLNPFFQKKLTSSKEFYLLLDEFPQLKGERYFENL